MPDGRRSRGEDRGVNGCRTYATPFAKRHVSYIPNLKHILIDILINIDNMSNPFLYTTGPLAPQAGADDIDRAVGKVIESGYRTADIRISADQKMVSTTDMGDLVVEMLME